jgi:hypothetical protein
MKSDLRKVKAGDEIWTIQQGWQKVISIGRYGNSIYPIETENSNTYTLDGKRHKEDKYPSAFTEYPFKEQPIEKDTLVWFRDSESDPWSVGYYSHSKKGKHWCFDGSKKSTETKDCLEWKIVTTENPLI